jgi:hypothetical protein
MKIFTCYEVSYPGAKLYTRVKKLVRNQTPHAHNSSGLPDFSWSKKTKCEKYNK